ncbi:MAG: AAA family ATPase [Acidimicrobiales bacterium]
MARMREADRQIVYEEGEALREECLIAGRSLFIEGAEVWTSDRFAELMDRFVKAPEHGDASFMAKLEGQMADVSPAGRQLMAELLYVYFLAAHQMTANTKQEQLDTILGWGAPLDSVPDAKLELLGTGLVHTGTYFMTKRDLQLKFLVELGSHLWTLDTSQRRDLVEDPWAFSELTADLAGNPAFPQRSGLLHLIHPDQFEAILSRDHKRRIKEAFSARLSVVPGDLDRALYEIRQQLEPEFGPGFDYYDPTIETKWNPKKIGAWDKVVELAKVQFDDTFDADEREYKLEIAGRLRDVRSALLAGDDEWPQLFRRAIQSGSNNLTAWRSTDDLAKWAIAEPEDAGDALRAVWGDNEADLDDMAAFLDRLPETVVSGPGTRASFGALMLLALDPENYPVYRATAFGDLYKLTSTTPPPDGSDEVATYDHAIALLDQMLEESASRGLELRDRLDAQGVLWRVIHHEKEAAQPAPPDGDDQTDGPETTADSLLVGDLSKLASDLLIDVGFLDTFTWLLEHRSQVILQGPPGTGKTYLARRFAKHFAGEDGSVELVQFHPSYAYEDFVQGFRPKSDGGFELRSGPLIRAARRAQKAPRAPHFLIIDEINRGNIAKVFGELYFLLEYRDETVTLQYDEEPFGLPRNLFVIGTMNTADRSIALVDSALRRRFHFVDLFPDRPPVAGLLDRHLEKTAPDLQWIAEVLDLANTKLGDADGAVGPSYFMREGLTAEEIPLLWSHAVLPYLAERFFGDPDRLDAFSLESLRRELTGQPRSDVEAEDDAPPTAD